MASTAATLAMACSGERENSASPVAAAVNISSCAFRVSNAGKSTTVPSPWRGLISSREVPQISAQPSVPKICNRANSGVTPIAVNSPLAPPANRKTTDTRVYCAWFSGGLRIVDIADPLAPREVGYFVPEPVNGHAAPQTNDVDVDRRGLVYLVDRFTGFDIVEFDG